MPKKLLISTLIIASSLWSANLLSPPANAEKLNINGTNYWTLDEVMEKGEKYMSDLKMCEKNRECEEYLDTAYILTENEYSAGQAFMDNFFIITAINPTESTIRVVFHDEANRRMVMPDDDGKKDVMQNLFLYWWDGDQSRWIYAFDGPEYEINRQDIFVHIGESGEKWLEPNKEVELKVPDFDFSHLKSSRIFFYAKSEKTNAAGDRDIMPCMNAIENFEGYECQAVFDWLGNIEYQPLKAKAKISTSDIGVPNETLENHTPSEGITEEISTNGMGAPENQTEAVSTPNATKKESPSDGVLAANFVNNSKTNSNTTPETTPEAVSEVTPGTAAEFTATVPASDTIEVPLAADKGQKREFPWWLIAFGLSGVLLILWWLIPIRRKKDQED